MIKQNVFLDLVHDLRNPPGGYPKFDFNYTFFIDEDGKTYGDLSAYIACRHLAHANQLAPFLAGGGDLEKLVRKATGMSAEEFKKLVYPAELVEANFDLNLVTGDMMADVIDNYVRGGCRKLDYRPILDMLEDDEEFIERNSHGGIAERVAGFMNRYGYKA